MGKLIDAEKALELYNENAKITIDKAPMPKFLWESIVRQATVEAISKDQYKADLLKELEELKKEMNSIKECEYQIYGKEHWNFVGKCQDVIQRKINSLNDSEDGT